MLYEQIKKQLNNLEAEFFVQLNESSEKRISDVQKIIQERLLYSQNNKVKLEQLNRDYLMHNENFTKALANLKLNIVDLEKELEAGLISFDNSFDKTAEIDKRMSLKEKTLQSIRNKYRRDLYEMNNKIEKVEKEKAEIIQDKQNKFDEEEKSFKQKVIDCEKKKKYEVQKIQNNTIKEYDELQKQLLIENNRKAIDALHKNIREIRRNGVINEKKVILNYFNDLQELDIAFDESKKSSIVNILEIENTYNIKIEDLKIDKKILEQTYQSKLDEYDYDVYEEVNKAEKEVLLSKLKFHETQCDKQDDALKQVITFKKNNQGIVYKKTQNYFDENNRFDLTQFNNSLALLEVNNDYISKMPGKFIQYISGMINITWELIVMLYQDYVNNLLANEKEILEAFTNIIPEHEIIQSFQVQEYQKKVDLLLKSYKINLDKKLSEFNNHFKGLLKQLLNQVEQTFGSLKELNSSINAMHVNYRTDLKNIFTASYNMAIDNLNSKNNAKMMEITTEEVDNNNISNINLNAVSVEKNKTNQYFIQENNIIEQLKKDNANRNLLELTELKASCDSCKTKLQTQIIEAKNNLKDQLKISKKDIKLKYLKEKENTENEYKKQIDLL